MGIINNIQKCAIKSSIYLKSVAGLDDSNYVFGLAVDLVDPNAVIVSAFQWPFKAYSPEYVDSLLYKRTLSSVGDGASSDGQWSIISRDLHEPRGTLISSHATNLKIVGEFCAASNHGTF